MSFVDYYYELCRKYRTVHADPLHPALSDFALGPLVANNLKGDDRSSLSKLFYDTKDHLIFKWVHYIPIYEQHFSPYTNQPVKMLEIGVSKGGSLDLWRRYFGPRATIFGVDIDPQCAASVDPPNQVRIGSQDDPDFLRSVVREMGAPDIILDVLGLHFAKHQRAAFEVLFPLLKEGGLYAIEDLHTSYWPFPYGGGYRRRGTAIEQVKSMIDDMHAWYHRRRTTTPAKDQIGAIYVYDLIVVIEKRRRSRPRHVQIGP